ncbi:hypothetical protein TRIUR3_20027 [Triticum urartu]|uniref:Uncharacterized protein n=1 Tax=Triticum urartu TaxID=4572 RepID=M7ZUT2_TRIUA|nr:hypothetical protein TRIUR3_20027 [Triticum urartu]
MNWHPPNVGVFEKIAFQVEWRWDPEELRSLQVSIHVEFFWGEFFSDYEQLILRRMDQDRTLSIKYLRDKRKNEDSYTAIYALLVTWGPECARDPFSLDNPKEAVDSRKGIQFQELFGPNVTCQVSEFESAKLNYIFDAFLFFNRDDDDKVTRKDVTQRTNEESAGERTPTHITT